MQLSAYLSSEKLNYAEFGRLAGLHRVTVRQYALGARKPRDPKVLARIAALTNNAVTANDFFAVEPAAAE